MSPQKKTAGGGGITGGQNRKGAKGVSGQKETSSVASAEQNNPQNPTANIKKHNIANSNVNNNISTDQLKTEKEKPHAKPTAEQIRIAQILEFKNGTQDPTREKVIQLMEMTERSEEDACLALYECDNDVEQAVIYLLENLEVGALVTNTKKKKNKSAQDGTGDGDEFESSNNRETSRGDFDRKGARGSNRGGSGGMGANRGRSRGGGTREGREGRETGENRGEDRGKPRGRGGFSNRGGRGRGVGNRGGRERNNFRPQEQPQEIDNWDPASTQIDTGKNEDQTWGNCGDWDNEEYTGSLAETKVFTPSTQQDISAPPGLEQQIHQPPPTVAGTASSQYGELHSASTAAQQLRQALEMPSLGQQSSVPLSAEQSQYFNTLGSQNSGPAAAYQSSVQYNYNDQQAPRSQQAQQQAQQQRTRARVPPPSKIPASAVEMPDVDLPAYLDVQFGGLDFGTGTEESYETDKFTQGIDQSTGDDYTKGGVTSKSAAGSQGLGGLQPSQLIQNSDSISSSTQADLSSGYAQRTTASMGTGTTQSALDQLKPGADIYASAATGTNAYQNLSYQSATQKGYQAGYGGNAYNATQTSSNYPASTNTYGGYNQSSYQQSQGTQSGGNVTGQQTQTSANGNVGAPNQSNTTGYMSSQYPNQSGYQSQQSSYQSQNVYASNANEFSGSINSLTSKLKGTQGTFDSSANTVSSGTSSVSSSTAITTSSINTSSLGGAKSSSTKTSSSQVSSAANATTGATGTSAGVGQSATNNGASNVVQNIPLVSSYMPAFYQQSYLPFEDMQLVQPRTMTYYYDQTTPTSLAGVRSDGTTPNLAYPTMSADGRFARTDNNSSPVQSQQTGSSQQLMNIPPYAYFYGTNVVPGGFQQFPQIYSQMPATNPTASQFAKQSAYSGGYGSTGYDTLNQTTPEYNKTTYQSSGQPSKGHSASSQSGTNTDIASSMYNKSHVTLNKVNSYDKQSFHSGTPPPFNLGSQAGSQTQAYQQHLYLPAMAPHHNINMHQPIHQMDGGRINNSRRDTSNSGQRQQSGNQTKSGSKPAYSTSTYWNTQN